ncbi:hypothetical protein [Halorhabdus amylolytica]|uniref:hypothetical protein n=1 Tax=Halorhabdus amylolytica TaxID=2559573 RepID=UPI0010A99CDF|nr:hypothetical protein [Halorhabdus amylolytica]
MTDDFSDRSVAEHQRVFDKIWSQNPDRQNWASSSWWFFLLFPEGEAGYGPRQLMFSIAACVGDQCRVNGLSAQGMDLDRPVSAGVDRFNATTVGWAGDDDQIHDHIVRQPAEAVLSQEDQRLEAWAEDEDGTRRGSEMTALSDRPIGLEAEVLGEDVEAEFEAWSALDSKMTAPHHSLDIDTPLGGVEVVALRQMDFEGRFDLPDGEETLSGSCYFQRVCFDMPLFPWKWIWAIFPDGTSFSTMVPFVGPQLFRRGYKFFSSNRLERLTIPLRQSGFWHWGSGGHVEFDRVTIEPLVDTGAHPDFDVRVENDDGDYVSFVARTYGHARNWLERERLGGQVASHWSYNEFMFRMAGLAGRVDGRNLDEASLGPGFGTLEYSTGLGL